MSEVRLVWQGMWVLYDDAGTIAVFTARALAERIRNLMNHQRRELAQRREAAHA